MFDKWFRKKLAKNLSGCYETLAINGEPSNKCHYNCTCDERLYRLLEYLELKETYIPKIGGVTVIEKKKSKNERTDPPKDTRIKPL